MSGEPMTTGWFYIKAGAPAGQQVGPLTWEQLFGLAQTGALTPSDLVWHESLPQWVPAGQMQGLFPATAFAASQGSMVRPVAPGTRKTASWLAWAIPLAVAVLLGAGLGIYFGLFHDKDADGDQVTVSSKTTTTADGLTTTTEVAPTTTEAGTTTSDIGSTTTEAETTTTTAPAAAGWTALVPTGVSPEARDGHLMFYHPELDRVIMSGGYGTDSLFDDTWSFDPGTNTWVETAPAGDVPPGRSSSAGFYDPISQRVILFGGWSDDLQLDDTWAYDPIVDSWSDLMPSGTYPSARAYHAMVYDWAADKAVLFGGWDDFNAADLADTFIYDAAANTWTDITPAGNTPSPRDSHAMVYDPGSGLTYLFGGYDGTEYLNDLWTYSLAENAWTELSPAGALPAPRAVHSMVIDSAGRLIVAMGYAGDQGLSDTWVYDPVANAWTELTFQGSVPFDRWGAAMVYDSAREQAIMFGGFDGEAELDDTWSLVP